MDTYWGTTITLTIKNKVRGLTSSPDLTSVCLAVKWDNGSVVFRCGGGTGVVLEQFLAQSEHSVSVSYIFTRTHSFPAATEEALPTSLRIWVGAESADGFSRKRAWF